MNAAGLNPSFPDLSQPQLLHHSEPKFPHLSEEDDNLNLTG